MDLETFIESHSQISEFDESRQTRHAQILNLIAKPMKLFGLNLVYDRSPLFNALLKAQGLKFKTIISLKNSNITGLFSVSTAPRLLKRAPVVVGYLGDFRIENDRRIASFWRNNYSSTLDLFSESRQLDNPNVFLTAILNDNRLAKKSLVGNSKRQSNFKYHYLRSVEMINILSKPLFNTNKLNIKIRRAAAGEENRVRDFIIKCETEKTLGFDFETNNFELWQQRKTNFPDFDLTNFLIAENTNGDLLAVTLPSSPSRIKRMIIKDLSWALKMFINTLKVFGVNAPKENQELKTLYLTHLNIARAIDSKAVLTQFLNFLHNDSVSKTYHMISFANWSNQKWGEYLRYSITVNLYEVTSFSKSPKILQPQGNLSTQAFGFEMALV